MGKMGKKDGRPGKHLGINMLKNFRVGGRGGGGQKLGTVGQPETHNFYSSFFIIFKKDITSC